MADETEKEEKLTLKSLKKDFEDFKEEVFKRLPVQPLAPVHGFSVSGEPVPVPDTMPEQSVTFHFHDRFAVPRTFSESANGDDWANLANAFHQNNVAQISKRIDD